MGKAIIFIAGKERDKDHSTSAGYIAGKLAGKTDKYDYGGQEVPILNSLKELKTYLESPAGKDVVKISILTHGNQEVVEGKVDKDYKASNFAMLLWSCGLKTLVNREGTTFPIRITLLACESGKAHPETGEIYVQQMASTFSKVLRGRQQIIVKGVDGHSFTTTAGTNHVFLTDGSSKADLTTLERALARARGDLDQLPKDITRKLARDGAGKPSYSAR